MRNVYKILCEAVTSFNDVIKNDTSRFNVSCIENKIVGRMSGSKFSSCWRKKNYTQKAIEVNDQVDLQFILMTFDQEDKN